jgi:DNA-binding transcriptional LysR family regulator
MGDPNDYVAFHAVVVHGGFSAAARHLRTPKGTLSKRIARLECQLGVRLLERSTRQIRPTEVGRRVFEHAEVIVVGLGAAAAIAAEAQAEPNGLVRLSCPQGLIHNLLTEILPAFLQAYPKVRVQLKELNRPASLVEDDVDLALRARDEVAADAALVVRRFGREVGVLAASPTFLDGNTAPLVLEDLSSLPTLAQSDERLWQLSGPAGERREVAVTPRLMSANFELLLAAAIEGLGVALLPEHICRASFANGALRPVLPEWRTNSGTIYGVFSSRRGLTPALRELIEFLAKEIGRRSAPL